MGVKFLEHIGGALLFVCANCNTALTNREELLSNRFVGATGRAYLFKSVVNLVYGEIEDRKMLTGDHKARDVFCKYCYTKLGWMYEFASEEDQRYKEGYVILERALLVQTLGMTEK